MEAAALSLAALLLEHPYRDDEGLVHTVDRSVTAGDARRAARAVAGALGDRAGRAVAVQLPNGPELVSAMAGVWLAGGVYVPVNPRQPQSELTAVIEATRPSVLLTASGMEPRATRNDSRSGCSGDEALTISPCRNITVCRPRSSTISSTPVRRLR